VWIITAEAIRQNIGSCIEVNIEILNYSMCYKPMDPQVAKLLIHEKYFF